MISTMRLSKALQIDFITLHTDLNGWVGVWTPGGVNYNLNRRYHHEKMSFILIYIWLLILRRS